MAQRGVKNIDYLVGEIKHHNDNFYEIFNIMRSQFLFDKFTNYFFLTIKNDCYNYWSFTHR